MACLWRQLGPDASAWQRHSRSTETEFFLGDDPRAAAEAFEEAVLEAERTLDEVEANRNPKRRKRKRKNHKKFPAHLPRYEKIVDLPDDEKEGKAFIGYDEVETHGDRTLVFEETSEKLV